MNEEPIVGEVEEGLLWFTTQMQAFVRWLWGMVSNGWREPK